MSDDLDILARGSTVGRYLVLERLGAGAMGVVYAAYDPELDRKIALKLLRPQQGGGNQERRQARMVREAKAIAKLSHPNVVGIFDVGVHAGQVFMAMEHLAGGTLADWMAAQKRPWRETVQMFIEVGHGLAAAHAEKLIHRDFKPDNVLLDKNGVPKVVDFGLVRVSAAGLEVTGGGADGGDSSESDEVEAPSTTPAAFASAGTSLTRTGALTGTPAYMAPEQFLGQAIDERTDQFAFCVALYEALYGERPFAGASVIALAESVTNGRLQPPPKNSQVPSWVRTCVVQGLKTDPRQRHAGFDELLAKLANDPAKRTRKWMLVGGTLVTMVAAVGVTHRLGSGQRTMCTGAGARLAGIWEPGTGSSERKAAIHRAFAASGKSYAEQAYTGAAKLLDQYVGRWTGMYTEACEATHVRGEQSAEVLDLRMACLKDRLGNARALSDVFATADGKVVENAVSAAASLPSLDRCADVPLLRAVVKPPEDVTTRERVDALKGEVAKLIALRESGHCSQALAKADDLIADARKVNYQPVLAEALYESALLGNFCSDSPQVLQRFKESYEAASASHDDDVAAQAAAVIPAFAINRGHQIEVASEWFGVAQGAVSRLGRETLANAMLATSEAFLASTKGEHARALAAADHAIDVTRRLLGPDDPLTITWQMDKGNWLIAAGRLGEALQVDISAREQYERVLGPEHPRVAIVSSNEGEVLNLLGRYGEAAVAYQRAIRLFRQSGADVAALAWALTGIGRARIGQNEPAAAIAPLEEALADRLERHAPAAFLGETRLQLARALWSQPGERARAIAVATQAREDAADDEKTLGEIDAWLLQARAHATERRLSRSTISNGRRQTQ